MPPKKQEHKITEGHHPSAVPKPQDDGDHKEPPSTGWDGPIPSKDGGDGEKDFYHKPPYQWHSDEFKPKYTADCWCGRVAFEIHGDPVGAKYCHCRQCQKLHGAPFQHAVLFFKTAVRIVKNDEDSLTYFSTERKNAEHHVPCKVSCNHCHSPLFDEGKSMVLAYPSAFNFSGGGNGMPKDFHPSAHIFYESRTDVKDGVAKWTGQAKHSELMEETTSDQGVMGKHHRGEHDADHAGHAPDPKRHKSDEGKE